MKVIYLAGPYRSKTEYGVHENIQAAEKIAIGIWKLGAACICPHKNTAYFGGSCGDSTWLIGDLEILRRCDAIFMMENWASSAGASMEHSSAIERKLPIFYELLALQTWLLNGELAQ